jgi:putative transposase
VRFWWNRFGSIFAAEIRKRRIQHLSYSRWRWHLDEVFVRINGETHYLWRAVDHEGEVLEVFATKRRDRRAALAFLKRAMKRYGRPQAIVTDRLCSYGAAMRDIGVEQRQVCGRWLTIELKIRINPFDDERAPWAASGTSRPCRSLPRFTPPCSITSAWTAISTNSFKKNRSVALAEWRQLAA